jgi:hypothetical protein
MKTKDIFGLAVRLLGLVFLYTGLKDVPMILDVPSLMVEEKSDILAAILPVVFNLLVACWLLRGTLLTRWAYPEPLKIPGYPHPHAERATEAPAQPRDIKEMDAAEKKLAALLARPKDDRAA